MGAEVAAASGSWESVAEWEPPGVVPVPTKGGRSALPAKRKGPIKGGYLSWSCRFSRAREGAKRLWRTFREKEKQFPFHGMFNFRAFTAQKAPEGDPHSRETRLTFSFLAKNHSRLSFRPRYFCFRYTRRRPTGRRSDLTTKPLESNSCPLASFEGPPSRSVMV